MDIQFNVQDQFKVSDTQSICSPISLCPVLPSVDDWISVLPEKLQDIFYFTLTVKEQTLFRIADDYVYPEDLFFSVNAGYCAGKTNDFLPVKPHARKYFTRRSFSPSCARYLAVGRIRL